MSVNTSRKPSSSANPSRTHSPMSSPINGPTPRNLSPSAAANIYGNGGGVKSYNSGWQMWGNAPMVGRGAGANDIQASQTDSNYRPNFPDSWPVARPTGSWDDEVAQQSEFDLSLGRASGVFGASKADNHSLGTRNGQPASHTYESSTRTDTPLRFPSIPSPNHVFRDTYSDQDSLSRTIPQPSISGTSDVSQLSLALRGMTVDDDAQGQRPKVSPTAIHAPAPPHLPQPHMYGAYPQVEYSSYYLAPTRENYGDYQYGYTQPDRSPLNPAALPGLYPAVAAQQYSHLSNHLDLHRGHSGFIYDYAGARPPSQYYYPPQPVLFPPTGASPMMTAQMPVPINEHKKRDGQSMVFNTMRSPPSPHTQGYGPKLDYQSAMAGLMPRPGPAFGLNPVQMFPHNGQPKRGAGAMNDSGATYRSPVLEEFRGNKARGWELKDIFGYVVEFCGDQHGSRFIQQKLETATPEEKQKLFDEIIPANGLHMVQDVFGNYVIQKLFEHGTSSQKTALVGVMEGHILSLATQMYGCRVVQKAIEYSTAEQQSLIIRELEPHVMKCVKDSNGNHVIQRLIEKVSPDRLGFVNTFRGNVFDLSTHPYGCRVLQRAFEHMPDEFTRPLMDELHKYSMTLTQDQFGNYVIQYVIEHGKTEDRTQVVSKLHGHMLHLARHKFASNVCEKALVCADSETRRRLIDELMTSTSDIGNPIIAMMRDQYANYVLQRAVIVAEADQRALLISKIKPHLINMRRFTGAYTKHLTSIERLIEKYPLPQSSDHANKPSLL